MYISPRRGEPFCKKTPAEVYIETRICLTAIIGGKLVGQSNVSDAEFENLQSYEALKTLVEL